MKDYLRLMRIRHYIKNFLIYTALVCSGGLFQGRNFLRVTLGFAAFCMISSVVYIINDIRDCEKDRLHPVKCRRPIASGKVSPRSAGILAAVLLLASMAANLTVFRPSSTVVILLYLLVNLGYSLGLKNVPLLDTVILVSGFILRMIYGAILIQVEISDWLYLTVFSAAFYFALGKRRNELQKVGDGTTRKVLRAYPKEFLNQFMVIFMTLTIIFYSLWSIDPATVARYGKSLGFTVPFVILIAMKYSMDIEGNSFGDPVDVLLSDKILLGLSSFYLLLMFLVFYF